MSALPPLILCVDDDPDLQAQMKARLEGRGYRVTCAGSIDEALRALAAEPPDAVLLDIMMETIDAGLQLLKEVRRRAPHLPVYLCSTLGTELAKQVDVQDLGADGLFEKPVDCERMLATLDRRLRRR